MGLIEVSALCQQVGSIINASRTTGLQLVNVGLLLSLETVHDRNILHTVLYHVARILLTFAHYWLLYLG